MDLLVCGLGNPGEDYRDTRHNVGFLTVGKVAAGLSRGLRRPFFRNYRLCRVSDASGSMTLVEPLTFMNRSGVPIPGLLEKYRLGTENLVIVCDTLDLPPGRGRLKRKGSSAGHKGLQSVINEVGSENFLRFYIGIGRPEGEKPVVEYVLEAPSAVELLRIEAVIDRTAEAIVSLRREGIDSVIQRYNASPS